MLLEAGIKWRVFSLLLKKKTAIANVRMTFFLSPRLFIHWLFYSPNWKFVLRSTVWWYPENITTKCNGKSIEATLTVYINKTVCLVLVLWCLSFVEVVWLIGLADPIKRFVWLDFIQPTQSPLYTKLILSFVKSYILNSDQMKRKIAHRKEMLILFIRNACAILWWGAP